MHWRQREWMMAKPPVRRHGREKSQQQSSGMLSTSHASPQQALMTLRDGRGSSPTRPAPPFCCRVFLGYRRANVSRTTVYYASVVLLSFRRLEVRQPEPVRADCCPMLSSGCLRPAKTALAHARAGFPPLQHGHPLKCSCFACSGFPAVHGTASSSQWHISLIF